MGARQLPRPVKEDIYLVCPRHLRQTRDIPPSVISRLTPSSSPLLSTSSPASIPTIVQSPSPPPARTKRRKSPAISHRLLPMVFLSSPLSCPPAPSQKNPMEASSL